MLLYDVRHQRHERVLAKGLHVLHRRHPDMKDKTVPRTYVGNNNNGDLHFAWDGQMRWKNACV